MKTKVLIVALAWLALGLIAGASGGMARLRPPLPQVILISLTGALLAAFSKAPEFRSWVLELPLRSLVLLHASRFVGIWFLVMHCRGQLPAAFAVPAGVGDIIVAVGALIVASVSIESRGGRVACLVWNCAGMVDILFVVANAARLAWANPESMRALVHLPLSLLPTFLVPIIIASHVVLLVRLGRMRRP